MANVKTAISLQKSIFDQAEALARELEISRSRLFAIAVEEFIRHHNNQKLLESINAAYDDVLDPEEYALRRKMKAKQRQLMREEPW